MSRQVGNTSKEAQSLLLLLLPLERKKRDPVEFTPQFLTGTGNGMAVTLIQKCNSYALLGPPKHWLCSWSRPFLGDKRHPRGYMLHTGPSSPSSISGSPAVNLKTNCPSTESLGLGYL